MWINKFGFIAINQKSPKDITEGILLPPLHQASVSYYFPDSIAYCFQDRVCFFIQRRNSHDQSEIRVKAIMQPFLSPVVFCLQKRLLPWGWPSFQESPTWTVYNEVIVQVEKVERADDFERFSRLSTSSSQPSAVSRAIIIPTFQHFLKSC